MKTFSVESKEGRLGISLLSEARSWCFLFIACFRESLERIETMTLEIWTWILAAFFLLRTNCQEDSAPVELGEISLTESGASVELNRFPWSFNDPLIFGLDFMSRSYSAQIVLLSASDVDGNKLFTIQAKLERRLLRVVMRNSADEVVAISRNLNTGM